MVHSTFGSNRPIVLSFLIVPAIALIVAAAYSNLIGTYGFGGPASDLLLNLFDGLPVWRRALGMLLIVGNAVLLNSIFNKNDFATGENYFPALVFLGFVVLDYGNIDLHPILFSNLFTLLAIRRLLTVYRAESAVSIGFDAALFLSLSVFFFPPAVIMLPLPWLVFLQVRPFSLKEWLVPLTAIVAALIYAFSFYFIGGYTFSPDEFLLLSGSSIGLSLDQIGLAHFLVIAVFLILTIFGLVAFFKEIAKSTLRKKSTKYIFLWAFFLMLLQYVYVSFLDTERSGSWLILATPVSVFLGVYFSGKSKKPIIRVVLFYIWLAACVSFLLFAN